MGDKDRKAKKHTEHSRTGIPGWEVRCSSGEVHWIRGSRIANDSGRDKRDQCLVTLSWSARTHSCRRLVDVETAIVL